MAHDQPHPQAKEKKNYIDAGFLHQLDRFSLIINKRLTSNYVGERSSRFSGRGLLFKDHSIYAPGEDFRTIDWKVFARTDKLYTKKYEEERNLTLHIVVDYSGSMKYGEKTSKASYAAMLSLGFAYLALKNNEKFVLSTFGPQLEVFRPRKGRKQLAAMLEYFNEIKPHGTTVFEQSLAKYKHYINSRSMVVVISDFLFDIAEIDQFLQRYKDHEVYLVQVLDPVEKSLNELEGDYKLKDSETSALMRTFISPLLRRDYTRKLSEHTEKLRKAAQDTGARFYSFTTNTPVFDAFYEMVGKGE